jgi:hypothetical protein
MKTWMDLWQRSIESIRHSETFARQVCSGHNVPMREDDPRAITLVAAWLLERPAFAHLQGDEGAANCPVPGGKMFADILGEGYQALGMIPAEPNEPDFPVDPNAAAEAEEPGTVEATSEEEPPAEATVRRRGGRHSS